MDLNSIIPSNILGTSKIIPKNIIQYVNHTIDSKLINYEKFETKQESIAETKENIIKNRLSKSKKRYNETLNNNITSILRTQIKANLHLMSEVKALKERVQIQSSNIEELLRTRSESAIIDTKLEDLITEKIQQLHDEVYENTLNIHKNDDMLARMYIRLPGIVSHDNIVDDKKDEEDEESKENKSKSGKGLLDIFGKFNNSSFKKLAALVMVSMGPAAMALPALMLLKPFISSLTKVGAFFKTRNNAKISDILAEDETKRSNKSKVKQSLNKTGLSKGWDANTRINLFSKSSVSKEAAQDLLKKNIKSGASSTMEIMSKLGTSSKSIISRVGLQGSMLGASAWGAVSSKSATLYDSVKAMATKLLPFFKKVLGNPKILKTFIFRLSSRIGFGRVAALFGKLTIAGTGLGLPLLLWAMYDVYDVSKEIYETINEMESTGFYQLSTVSSSIDKAKYLGIDKSYEKEYNAGYSEDYVKTYEVQKPSYDMFGNKNLMSTDKIVKNGTIFKQSIDKFNPKQMSMGTPTSSSLIELVKSNESFSATYYPDAHGYSIGYGHFAKGNGAVPVATILKYEPINNTITKDEAEILLQYDLDKAKRGVYSLYPWLSEQPQLVQNHMVDMTYNLGVGGMSDFAPTMAHIQKGEYELAANRLTKTKWYNQVGNRAKRIVQDLQNLSLASVDKIEQDINNTESNINSSTTDIIKQNNTLSNTLNTASDTPGISDTSDIDGSTTSTIKQNSTLSNILNTAPNTSEDTEYPKFDSINNIDFDQLELSNTKTKKSISSFINSIKPTQQLQSTMQSDIINNNVVSNSANSTILSEMNSKTIPMIHKNSFS